MICTQCGQELEILDAQNELISVKNNEIAALKHQVEARDELLRLERAELERQKQTNLHLSRKLQEWMDDYKSLAMVRASNGMHFPTLDEAEKERERLTTIPIDTRIYCALMYSVHNDVSLSVKDSVAKADALLKEIRKPVITKIEKPERPDHMEEFDRMCGKISRAYFLTLRAGLSTLHCKEYFTQGGRPIELSIKDGLFYISINHYIFDHVGIGDKTFELDVMSRFSAALAEAASHDKKTT